MSCINGDFRDSRCSEAVIGKQQVGANDGRIPAKAGSPKPLNVIQLGEIAIKGRDRSVPSLSGNLKNKTVREADGRPFAVLTKSCGHHIRVLNSQVPVIQQHLNCQQHLLA